jgi:hypothetical protein
MKRILGPIAFAAALAVSAVPVRAADRELPPGAVPAILGNAVPVIGVDEVRTGQKGYGLSVFAGSEPERFEVEVVGVMRDVSPGVSYILGKLTGKGLEQSGVASGMSGSPVFIDGKLAGAVAFSWPFSNEAIAGITPIDAMRKLSTLGGGTGQGPSLPPPPVELAELMAGRVPKDLLERELARLQPKMAMMGARASVQWATMGFGEQSQEILRRALGSVSPSGRMAATSGVNGQSAGKKDLVLGGAVAAVLVDGDLHISSVGTVTDRYDDHVLAFGHPFLGMGTLQVPMATAEVVTVLSSQYSSFKIANVGQEIGAFEQDRQAGIQGRIGQVAPMTPMVVRVGGPGIKPQEFRMRVADVPLFTPMLIGSSLLAGLESASFSTGAQSLDMTARFRLRGYGDLEIRQTFDGENAGTEAAGYAIAIAAYLVQNPLERVSIEDVQVELTQSPQPKATSLVGANADRTVVRPGETVGLNLDLVAWRGERFRHSMKVTLPEDLPAGRYSLIVGDGASIDAARMAMEPAAPVSFPQALELLRSFHSRRDLMVLGVYGGPGLSVAGEVMPRLPGSVRSLWSAAASGSATPLRVTIAQEQREVMDVPIDGAVRVDLEVRRREPVAGSDQPAGQPAGEQQPAAESVASVNGGSAR